MSGGQVESIPGSRRERARAATIDEIKSTALELMRENGAADVRFSDIARAMGMTAPALYRYFADRDELLTAMIADGYDDLAAAIASALQAAPTGDVGAQFPAVARAYRDWARAQPQRFSLIFGSPVPGYTAPEDGPTTEAARRAMAQLESLFLDAIRRRKLRKPLLRDVEPALLSCIAKKHTEGAGADAAAELPPETHQAILHVWAALHGFVSLEAHGHLEEFDGAARDALFASQVQLLAKASGLPVSERD